MRDTYVKEHNTFPGNIVIGWPLLQKLEDAMLNRYKGIYPLINILGMWVIIGSKDDLYLSGSVHKNFSSRKDYVHNIKDDF